MALWQMILYQALILPPLFVLGLTIYNLFLHPLRSYPGPLLARATRWYWIWYLYHGKLPFKTQELHDKYGPVVRIAPDELSYISSQAWHDIYNNKDFIKDAMVLPRPPNGSINLVIAEGHDHKRMRQLQSHAFSSKALSAQEPLVHHYVDLLIARLYQASKDNKATDLVKWFNYITFDVIGALSFSRDFNCLTTGIEHPFIEQSGQYNESGQIMVLAERFPFPFNRIVRELIPGGKELIKSRQKGNNFTYATARERLLKKDKESVDFMSFLLKHNDSERGMSIPELEASSTTFIVAGSDTTSTTMSGAIYNLLTNPIHLTTLTNLIRTNFQDPSAITAAAVSQLSYLNAILDENFRIYPAAPAASPKIVPKGGATIDGKFVPAGTSVGIAQWSAHRTKLNFSNPEKFDPERWTDPEKYEINNLKAVHSFGFGPRICIGKNLAYIEIRLTLASILWHFDLELDPSSKDWFKGQTVYFLPKKHPLFVKITPRKDMDIKMFEIYALKGNGFEGVASMRS